MYLFEVYSYMCMNKIMFRSVIKFETNAGIDSISSIFCLIRDIILNQSTYLALSTFCKDLQVNRFEFLCILAQI